MKAIDLLTRRLIASGQRPVTVGTFFSLGHSTIVIITSVIVAATSSAISSKFGAFSRVGGIIGIAMNVYILFKLVHHMRELISAAPHEEQRFEIQGAGCLFYLFKKMFKLIDRPWKMYPLGLMFGLGFDTSSEVALLGIASIQGAKGGAICCSFVVFGGLSALVYRPWRRRIDRKRQSRNPVRSDPQNDMRRESGIATTFKDRYRVERGLRTSIELNQPLEDRQIQTAIGTTHATD
ncbi:MAG: hypothetical protein Q9163_000139 [Psora crenata]